MSKEIKAVLRDYKNMMEDNYKFLENALEEEMKNFKAKEKEFDAKSVPNDKIILSADLFAKIVNTISFAQSQGLLEDDLLDKIFADVKENRTVLEAPVKETAKPHITLKDLFEKKKSEDEVKMNDVDKTEKKFSKNDNVRVFNLNDLLQDETVRNMFESILGDNVDWRRM